MVAKQFQCEVCTFWFDLISHLKKHISLEPNQKNKNYFTSKSNRRKGDSVNNVAEKIVNKINDFLVDFLG